jgi:hypothetical protein
MKGLFTVFLLSLVLNAGYSQFPYVLVPLVGKELTPEHGFLPGKKFKIYPTINKYDFSGLKMRVELYDQRDSLQLRKIECSDVEINNMSEFAGQHGALAVKEYFQTLSAQSGIILDSIASDTLKVYLEALDSRLIGFGSITAHGLCKMIMKYKDFFKSYCTDITDKSPHSPINKNALVTRKTATRVIQSASIREVIEAFFVDLLNLKK